MNVRTLIEKKTRDKNRKNSYHLQSTHFLVYIANFQIIFNQKHFYLQTFVWKPLCICSFAFFITTHVVVSLSSLRENNKILQLSLSVFVSCRNVNISIYKINENKQILFIIVRLCQFKQFTIILKYIHTHTNDEQTNDLLVCSRESLTSNQFWRAITSNRQIINDIN